MNNDTLENVTSDKLLGVTIDHNLSWEKHITTICLTLTTVQLSGTVHHIHREPVTSSKESSLDIEDIYHHSEDMFFSLKWMPIHDRIKFCKVYIKMLTI